VSGDPSGSPRAVDWTPSKAQWAWINLVGVALTVLGFVGHFAAWALSRSSSGGRFGLTDVVMFIVVTVVLIVAHELGHGLALRKLRQVGSAEMLEDLRVPPGNRLEALKGDRAGQHSIRINDQ